MKRRNEYSRLRDLRRPIDIKRMWSKRNGRHEARAAYDFAISLIDKRLKEEGKRDDTK